MISGKGIGIATLSSTRVFGAPLTILLIALLAWCIDRLWLAPLSSSLWVDEIVTTFVLRFPHHYSFAAAPQVPDSIYYWLPRVSWAMFGNSEAALRLPSLLAMGLALFFVARVAIRVIHPRAGWLAIFLCLTLSGIDYFAVDARPYALGIAVASASILFLIRWFDRGKWTDELIFVVCALSLWRIHMLYWPFYLVYASYGAARIRGGDVKASRTQIFSALALLIVALAPVALTAAGRLSGAQTHVFNPLPAPRTFLYLIHVNVVLICGALAWILSRFAKGRETPRVSSTSWILILGWWLACPLCIFAYSWLSGNGVFIARYLSLMLPGIALTATAVATRFLSGNGLSLSALSENALPENTLKAAAVPAAFIGLVLMGHWTAHPGHEVDDWRAAAAVERSIADEQTPVLCASPFVEARWPVWRPNYPLPGFLYSNLTYYPVRGNLKLFPFVWSADAEKYADRMVTSELVPAGKFVLYGSAMGSGYLMKYFSTRAELLRWRVQTQRFGNILIARFESESSPRGPECWSEDDTVLFGFDLPEIEAGNVF